MRTLLFLTLAVLCVNGASLAADNPANVNTALGLNPVPGRVEADRNAQPAVSRPAPGSTINSQPQLPPMQPLQRSTDAAGEVFGAQLFTGSFARQGATQFNPDYMITTGDQVQIRMWGGYSFDNMLTVDPQGNIFLPQIGPLKILGARNNELQQAVETAVRKVFRHNVSSYASLAAAQPVRIFVGGFVNRPGLFHGTSMDSLLHYLDQAGGIDTERGSFLEIQVKRGEQVRTTINLYDFLLQGRIPLVQLADGDVIFVSPRKNTVQVTGLADSGRRFEFRNDTITIADLSRMAKPQAHATHVRVIRNTGMIKNIDYHPLTEAGAIVIGNGDEVQFTADKKPGTITVRVEGEHQSVQEYVLPYGSRVGSLLQRIEFTERSDTSGLQLYRHRVRERQKALLQTSMRSLEASVLTARSGTSDEARLRKDEAELILQWVDRAKKIEPGGQVMIAQAAGRDQLLLENGDVIRVPARDGLVLVSGEVLFPNAIAHDAKLALDDYIRGAGGYTQNADNSRVVIAHRDGSFDDGATNPVLRPGDEVLVLPKVDVKSRQIWKDLTQIIFQIAISAKVVFGL